MSTESDKLKTLVKALTSGRAVCKSLGLTRTAVPSGLLRLEGTEKDDIEDAGDAGDMATDVKCLTSLLALGGLR